MPSLKPVIRDPNNIPVDMFQSVSYHAEALAAGGTWQLPINCRALRIVGGADMYYSIGTNLGDGGNLLPKNIVEYVPIFIEATLYMTVVNTGTFYVTEFL